jgi:hypothetical protein
VLAACAFAGYEAAFEVAFKSEGLAMGAWAAPVAFDDGIAAIPVAFERYGLHDESPY